MRLLGLMSGTSLDAVDCCLIEVQQGIVRTLAHQSTLLPAVLRTDLQALQSSGPDELHRAALAANALAEIYAQACFSLLADAEIPSSSIAAIGAHGQTVRHSPAQGYTWQLLNGALLAQLTNIDVVCELRAADIAAGGQGAPLVPAFHQAVFGQSDRAVAILNLGGIANLSLLVPGQPPRGFDTGPANTLLDGWIELHQNVPYDNNGHWASGGNMLEPLLASLLSDPYFSAPAPKSTGRDYFNITWLEQHLNAVSRAEGFVASPQDVQATLLELTARTVSDALALEASRMAQPSGFSELVICGGGSKNQALVKRLADLLGPTKVSTSQDHDLDPQAVEAAAFAWLAWCRLTDHPGALPSVTGARNFVVSGALHRKPSAVLG